LTTETTDLSAEANKSILKGRRRKTPKQPEGGD
jgi:hypothetical protein